MEKQIRKLEAALFNKPDDFQLNETRRQAPTYKSIIKRSLHGEFLLTTQSMEIPSHDQASLEVLVTEHSTSATLGPDRHTASHPTEGTHQQTPERLRIRYAPLVKTLEKVCRETLSNYNFWPTEREPWSSRIGSSSATILLRPWKLLIAYEKEIRDSVHNIDALVEPVRREDVSGEVAETGVLEDCKCFLRNWSLYTLHAPHGVNGAVPRH